MFCLVLGGAVGWLVARAFDLERTASRALMLQAAIPVAISSYLFALHWNCERAEVAAMVSVSTIAACATIPLLMRRGVDHPPLGSSRTQFFGPRRRSSAGSRP